jgi:hypothetical protein
VLHRRGAPGRCAEALFHEFEGGVGEWGEGAFGADEEAGKELVGEGVDAIGSGGLLAHEGAAAAGDFAEVVIGGSVGRCVASGAGAARKQGFGDA